MNAFPIVFVKEFPIVFVKAFPIVFVKEFPIVFLKAFPIVFVKAFPIVFVKVFPNPIVFYPSCSLLSTPFFLSLFLCCLLSESVSLLLNFRSVSLLH